MINLAVIFKNQSTITLQQTLQISAPLVKQVWLADDATGAGSLVNMKRWWDIIVTEGVKYGYCVNSAKSWLIVKDDTKLAQAKQIFEGTDIQSMTSGKRQLGDSIGSDDFRTQYTKAKVKKWQYEVEKLSEFAKTEPQAAYAAYTLARSTKLAISC